MKQRIFSILLVISITLTFIPVQTFANNADNTYENARFKDMAKHWASETVNELAGLGLITGYTDNTFKPDKTVTRAEFCTMINKVFGYTDTGKDGFIDVKSTDWYYDAVMKAKEAGIISGYNNSFFPEQPVSRQDASVILNKAFGFISNDDTKAKTYKDFNSINVYAANAMAVLVSKGYMSGFPDNTLKPLNSITRAEAAALIKKTSGAVINANGEYSKGTAAGNIVISTSGVTLKDTVIKGDLFLAEGIGEGEVIMDNVTVSGKTIIKAGGMNSIIFRNSKLGNVTVKKKNKPVRVVFENKTQAEDINVACKSKIELSSDSTSEKMHIDKEAAGTEMTIKGDIKKVDIMAENVEVNNQTVKAGTNFEVKDGIIKTEAVQSTAAAPAPSVTGGPSNGSDSAGSEWSLVMDDEFNGDKIDTSTWTAVNTKEVYNNEDEYYTDANTYIQDGKLVLEAKKEANGEYSSAKLVTKNKKAWTYGKFEIKAKMPEGQGIWPAIWMLPEDDNIYGGWPSGGEIDIMELLGNRPDKIYGTIHYGNPHSSGQGEYTLAAGKKFSDDYHIYGVEWEPGEIRWYVDGQLYHKENNWYSRNLNDADSYTYPAPFDRDFYMILNLAVGGDWPGHPDSTTVFPSKMYVDYVKAYKLIGRPYRNAGERPTDTANTGRLPLSDGNYIYNGSFDSQAAGADGIDNNDGSAQVVNTSYWTFSHVSANTGEAKASNDNGALRVDITNEGNVNYGVQFYQKPINLEKGESYKVSFDAWASENRTMITKLGSEADRGWANYSGDKTIQMTTAKQTFSYQFKMSGDTNTSARMEFNMGNQGTNTVWLDNVRLEKLPKDPNAVRDPLPSGNLVYNGTFDEGSKSMEFWNFTVKDGAIATGSVDSNPFKREFKAGISSPGAKTGSVTLWQDLINLEKGKSYKVTFSARADKNRSIKVNLANAADPAVSYSIERNCELTANMDTYSFGFEMTAETDPKAQLQFNIGGDTGTIYIDNVSVKSFVSPNTAFYQAEETNKNDGVTDDGDGSVSFNSETAAINDSINIPKDGNYVISYRVASSKDTGWLSVGDIKNKETIPNTSNYWRIVTNSVYLKAGTQNITIYGNDVSVDWFEITEDIVKDGTMKGSSANWTYWSNSPAASTKDYIEGKERISVTNTGANPWDIGVQQLNINVEKGRLYRLSFDAKSTVDRAIGVSLDNIDDTVTYAKYMSKNVTLTNEMKNYIIDFTMDAESDPNAALTLQLGSISQSPVSDIYLDNVRLVEISDIEINGIQTIAAPVITEPADVIVPSADDSVYSFEDGTNLGFLVKRIVSDAETDTVATIENDGTMAFLGSKSLKVNVPNNESEVQVAINNPDGISAGQTITFNVYCPTGSAITAIMPFMLYNNGVADWSWTSGTSVAYTDLAGNWKAVTMTVPADHSGKTQKLGVRIYPDSTKTSGPIWIDSIQIQNAAPSANGNLITDGDFSSGLAAWSLAANGGAADPIYVTTGGALAVNVTSVGDANYKPQLSRGSIALENNASYTLTFKASSAQDRNIEVSLLDPANSYHYFGGNVYSLTNTEQTFTMTFTADSTTNTAALQFNFGAVTGISIPTTIYIDDVTLVKNP